MSDYRQTLHEAVWRMPVAAAMALWPAGIERRGGEISGPSWAQQAGIAAAKEKRAELKRTHRIL